MTPITKVNDYYLKREDQNPTGSAKDRAIQVQIDHLIKNKFKSAVISSTGNAAISAAYFCHQKNIPLHIFITQNINSQKLKLLESQPQTTIHQSPKPISQAIKFSKTNSFYLLRQSTDPIAIKAYSQIGKEIIDQLPQVSSIFIPVGSGATFLGIRETIPQNIKIYAIQSAANPTLAKYFDKNFKPESINITDALTVKTLPLRQKIISALKQSKSLALAIQKNDIVLAQKELSSRKIKTSYEGALALAGFYKAKKMSLNIGPNPLIILTGALR